MKTFVERVSFRHRRTRIKPSTHKSNRQTHVNDMKGEKSPTQRHGTIDFFHVGKLFSTIQRLIFPNEAWSVIEREKKRILFFPRHKHTLVHSLFTHFLIVFWTIKIPSRKNSKAHKVFIVIIRFSCYFWEKRNKGAWRILNYLLCWLWLHIWLVRVWVSSGTIDKFSEKRIPALTMWASFRAIEPKGKTKHVRKAWRKRRCW